MIKTIVVALHGLTDIGLKQLGGQTPLEKAHTPHLDFLAQNGDFFTVTPPKNRGLETALCDLLDVNNKKKVIAQGALEAVATGYALQKDEVCFCFRFVSLYNDVIVDVNKELLSEEEANVLCLELTKQFSNEAVKFLPLDQAKGILITKHPDFQIASRKKTHIPFEALNKKWKDMVPYARACEPLLKKANQILASHEVNALKSDLDEPVANGILIYNGGFLPKLSGIFKEEEAKTMLYTHSMSSRGLAQLLNMDLMSFPKEKYTYQHYPIILNSLNEVFQGHDLLILEFHHLWHSTVEGKLLNKIKRLEFLDKQLLQPLIEYVKDHEYQLAVLSLGHCNIQLKKMIRGDLPAAVFFPKQQKPELSVPQFNETALIKSRQKISLSAFMRELMLKIAV